MSSARTLSADQFLCIFTARQRSDDGFFFICVCPSVVLSMGGRGSHVPITHDVLDLTWPPAPTLPFSRSGDLSTEKLSILKSFFNFVTSNFSTMISGHLQIWDIWVFFKWHSSESGMIYQRCVIEINVDLLHKEVDPVKIWKFYHCVWLGIYSVWFETINTYPGVVKNSAIQLKPLRKKFN